MRTLILISSDQELRARLSRARKNYSIFSAASEAEALRTLRTTEVDVVIEDTTPPVRELAGFIARVRQLSPTSVTICLYPTGPLTPEDEEALEAFDFVLRKPFTSRELSAILRQAEEKHTLLLEVSALRTRRTERGQPVQKRERSSSEGESVAPPSSRVVKEFAKALAAGFDLPRMLDLFLDAVSEMLKPSRCALLLPEESSTDFRIRAHWRLPPYVVESVRLSPESGLPLWLYAEGRLITAEDARVHPEDAQAREILRELSLLQAVLAIPMIAHGELVAILTLGQRVTGVPYTHSEIEILFNLATHLATAICDIQLHHKLQYQNAYIEQILAHMSNGVVTIDREQKV
ncbi:MAG: GAF domain-containing protein, partial [Candidatus Methylomirabilia bacterium]